MKIYLLALLILLTFNGCNNYQDELNKTNASSGNIQAGLNVFNQFACANCHGADGKTPALGVSRIITDISTIRDVENALFALKSTDSSRNQIMKDEAAKLSKQDIIDLAAYIKSL